MNNHIISLEQTKTQKGLNDFDSLTSNEQESFYAILFNHIVATDQLQGLYNSLKDASLHGEHNLTEGIEEETAEMFNLLQKFIVDSGDDLHNFEVAYNEYRESLKGEKADWENFDETDEIVYF